MQLIDVHASRRRIAGAEIKKVDGGVIISTWSSRLKNVNFVNFQVEIRNKMWRM